MKIKITYKHTMVKHYEIGDDGLFEISNSFWQFNESKKTRNPSFLEWKVFIFNKLLVPRCVSVHSNDQ